MAQQHAPKELKALLDKLPCQNEDEVENIWSSIKPLHKIFQNSAWGDVVQKKALELRNQQVRFCCIHFVESSTTTTTSNKTQSPSNLDHKSINPEKITKTSSNKGILQLRYPLGSTATT